MRAHRGPRPTLLLVATLLALTASTVVTTPAFAYHLGGRPWPGRTITYHSAAPQYAHALSAAVRAWNASGARIHFKRAAKGRAKLQLTYTSGVGGPSGFASLGYARPGDVTYQELDRSHVPVDGNAPCGARVPIPGQRSEHVRCYRGPRVWLSRVGATRARDPEVRNEMALTVAHELGHVLGLEHMKRTCAVMSYERLQSCPRSPDPWSIRCRLLEADDVRGAVHRYGGRVRRLAAPFCRLTPIPAPSAVTATFDGDSRRIEVTWTNTSARGLRTVRTAVAWGGCPERPDAGVEHFAERGAEDSIRVGTGARSGSACIALWSEDADGRLGPPTTVVIDVPPPPDGF